MATKDCYLPSEIILKILLILPGSSLMKFQTLSKSFRAMIKSPDFIKLYLNLASSSTKPQLILLFHSSRISFVDNRTWTVRNNLALIPSYYFSSEPSYQKLRYGGSCNGFVCLYDDYSKNATVVNPATREYLTPFKPLHLYDHSSCTLGFASLSKEYKLVYFSGWRFRVCSLGDMLFRQVDIFKCPILQFNGEPRPCGVLSHDALFWLGFGSDKEVCLLRFDLEEEIVTYIHLNIGPLERKSNDFMLGVLGGEVCLTITPNLQFSKKDEMHLLIFDGEKDFSRKIKLMVPKHSYMTPLFISGEKILLQDRCFDVGLYCYNLSNGSCEKVFVADSDFRYPAHPHIDSSVGLEETGAPLSFISKELHKYNVPSPNIL
jgi:F-box interacting protein